MVFFRMKKLLSTTFIASQLLVSAVVLAGMDYSAGDWNWHAGYYVYETCAETKSLIHYDQKLQICTHQKYGCQVDFSIVRSRGNYLRKFSKLILKVEMHVPVELLVENNKYGNEVYETGTLTDSQLAMLKEGGFLNIMEFDLPNKSYARFSLKGSSVALNALRDFCKGDIEKAITDYSEFETK